MEMPADSAGNVHESSGVGVIGSDLSVDLHESVHEDHQHPFDTMITQYDYDNVQKQSEWSSLQFYSKNEAEFTFL